jgi:hypothetical protein
MARTISSRIPLGNRDQRPEWRILMGDTCRRYGAIARSLLQLYRPSPVGHQRKHLSTLILLICGLVGAQHSHLSKVVSHTPGGKASDESMTKRFRRWLANPHVTYQRWMLPVAKALLTTLSSAPLLIVIDGSTIGRGGMALMASVVYRGRALPLVWLVITSKKGHLPQALHCDLITQVQQLVPPGANVTILGDGEYDGTDLQATITTAGWQYVCRTATNVLIHVHGQTYDVAQLQPARGESLAVTDVQMTAARYGPVHVIAVWDGAYETPIYLVTAMTDLDAAVAVYRKRAHIETLFSDHKSRGFQVQRSHISDPKRLERLLLATALAYLWVVFLGVVARTHPAFGRFHRPDRCDLSLFQLGLRFLNYCLRHRIPIPLTGWMSHMFSVR